MKLYVDDDGYICFHDGGVFWTLHHNGWEASMPDTRIWHTPIYETGEITFPTDDEIGEVQAIYEQFIKLKK